MPTVCLKPGHVQPVWADHPWVFAQAIDRVEGGATAGDEVSVVDPRGQLLGRGFYSPTSAIPVRLLVRDAKTPIDGAFFRGRLTRAKALRQVFGLPSTDTTGYRLVHSEGDGLAGLVCDVFGDIAVVQLLTVGMKRREGLIFEALQAVMAPRAIVDRTPQTAGIRENMPVASGVVRGSQVRELCFRERGLRFEVPLDLAQKTGFYFDQRDVRARVEALSRGKRVLDTYTFVGPFSLAAARGGATEVVAVDESALGLEVAAECARLNGFQDRIRFGRQDARKALQEAGQAGGYDLVIVDPPRYAPSRSAREQALQAYAKLAEQASRAVTPGGLLVFCSCSAAVDLASLTRALATGARRANLRAVVCERLLQGADHPVAASFAEGLYLKALVARIETR